MVQGLMNHSHGGVGGGELYSWNENKVGFSDSDGFQNSLIASETVNQYGFGADKKRIKLMGSNQPQVGREIDLFGESEPLGLSLKKTPSFLNLIEAKLSQGTKETTTPNETNQISKRSRSRTTDLDSQTMSEKLKASNFIATLLRIGNWERVAKNEGDLVAKCYYAKRKLVWEVLENGLKSKIEILWSDISAIRASFPEQQPGTLEIELKHEPKFYREHNPQPRKHTLWHEALDFTGGQAKIYRRHYLQFPEGTLEKHFEKLLQYDKELLKLSQRKFPVLNSPFFESDPCESHQDFYLDFKGHHHQKFPSMLQFSHLAIQSLPPYPVPKFNQTIGPPFVTPNDSASPMSVMDVPFFDESIGYPGIQQQRSPCPCPFMEHAPVRNDDQPFHMAWGNQAPEPPIMMASHTQVGQFIPQFGESNDDLLGRGSLHSNNWPPNSVYDHLLNEPDQSQQRLDEQRLLAKVNSMACLLQPINEQQNHEEEYSYGDDNTNNSMESSSTDQSSYGNGEWPNNYQDPISWIPPPQGCNDLNVPRTQSFPCLDDFSNVNHHYYQWR